MASDTDKNWFEQNKIDLEGLFKGQIIAILNEKVIAHADNFDEVSDKVFELKKSGKIKGIPIIVRASKTNSAAIKIPSLKRV